MFSSVMDLAPTFLALAETSYPSAYKGNKLAAQQGSSLLPMLRNEKEKVHPENYTMGWELFGRCALRKGKWKITKIEAPFGKGDFSLFNLEEDPTESVDLSQRLPEKYQEMLTHWNAYVKENGVILLNR
jgi:arylsulfatase